MSTTPVAQVSPHRWTVVAVTIVSLVVAQHARADIDLTGGWDFAPNVIAPTTLPMTIVQSGTSLSVDVNTGVTATGTVVPATGSFSVATTAPTCMNFTLQGNTTDGGNTLTGIGTVDVGVQGGLCTPVSITFTATRVPCGNGVIDSGEGCDDGNRHDGDCCSSTCTPDPFGTRCAGSGEACIVNACDGAGVCAHVLLPGGTICRASIDTTCDVAEVCDGVSEACPPDQVRPAGTVCRPSTAACDSTEVCTGRSPVCPPDVTPPDIDGDGVPDPCDACPTGLPASKAQLHIGTYDGGGANDKLKVLEKLPVSSAAAAFLDPIATGMVLLVADPSDAGALSVIVPPGTYDDVSRQGWTVSHTGHGSTTLWKFRSVDPSLPVAKARVRLSLDGPPEVQFQASGSRRSFAVTRPALPLRLRVVLDPPASTSVACGEASFGVPGSPAPRCALRSHDALLSCR
jgi:cysteine-rich repeat protein